MAFGKKNQVKLDILSYNLMLLGEAKCGKTTLIKEVCEKLAGEDGYLFLEVGSERGADAISNINYINCPEWNMDYDEYSNSAGFADVCEDIIENKTTEYPNLKVVVWDTYDHLIDIAEKESIRLWNKECREKNHPEKAAKTINQAWSGFGKGEKIAISLMLDMMARLRMVGVSTIVIGHVKTKDIDDAVSGESYRILTSDQQQNYFNVGNLDRIVKLECIKDGSYSTEDYEGSSIFLKKCFNEYNLYCDKAISGYFASFVKKKGFLNKTMVKYANLQGKFFGLPV